MFQALGFIGSILSASATIAQGQEIKRQKEAEAAQIEPERFQRKIQTMEAHNDILDQLEDAEEANESLFGFILNWAVSDVSLISLYAPGIFNS